MTALRRLVPVLLAIVGAGLLVVPATPAAAASAGTLEGQALRFLQSYRVRKGCARVRPLVSLNTAARRHSADMARNHYFSHVSPRTGTFVNRAVRAGYAYPLSENIAWGQRTGLAVYRAWFNSPGHARNMGDCTARSVGHGLAYATNGTPYWTQVFGRV